MCKVCVEAMKLGKEDGLALIGKAIEEGASPDHFESVTDAILGTAMRPRDREIEGMYEDKRRA